MKTNRSVFNNIFLATSLLIFISCGRNNEVSNNNKATVETETTLKDNLPNISDYPIVGTNQTKFYNNKTEISATSVGDDFYGQNANYLGNTPKYVDNGDGTITDMVTGLMWQQSPDTDGDGKITAKDKFTYEEALAGAAKLKLGGYTDWRMPRRPLRN